MTLRKSLHLLYFTSSTITLQQSIQFASWKSLWSLTKFRYVLLSLKNLASVWHCLKCPLCFCGCSVLLSTGFSFSSSWEALFGHLIWESTSWFVRIWRMPLWLKGLLRNRIEDTSHFVQGIASYLKYALT